VRRYGQSCAACFHLDGVADLCVGLDLECFGERDFVLRILYVFDNNQVCECADVTGFWIDVDAANREPRPRFFSSREQCVGDRFEEDSRLIRAPAPGNLAWR